MTDKDDNQNVPVVLKTPDDSGYSEIGKAVRKQVLHFKEDVLTKGDSSSGTTLSPVEEKIIQATTGLKVAPDTQLFIFPFGVRNPLLANYEAPEHTVAGFHPVAEIGVGAHKTTLNELSLVKERPGLFQEMGVLESHDGRGPSILGNVNPKAPMLSDTLVSAGVGTNGGIGFRESRGFPDGVTFDTQIAAMPHLRHAFDILDNKETTEKTAPTRIVSMSKAVDAGSKDTALASATVFSGDGNSGGDITAALQHRFNKATLDLSAEGMQQTDGSLTRIGAELSRHVEGEKIIPYARTNFTRANGDNLPNGVAQGISEGFGVGAAANLGEKLRVFCEVNDNTKLGAGVQCGFQAQSFAGVVPVHNPRGMRKD